MFEDSLLESSGKLANRHPIATVVSFAGQLILLTVLLLLSLLYTESLPTQHWVNILQAPPPTAGPPRSVATPQARGGTTSSVITVPPEIPPHVSTVPDGELSQKHGDGIAGDFRGGIPTGVNGSVLEMMKPVPPASAKPVVQKFRVSSGVAEGMLVRQVKPQYPAPAKLARIEGRVSLQAVIGKDGAIENLHVISGHPLLVAAAIDAVKQWRYKPYFLNGEPVEVETQIVVNFVLTHD